MKKSKKGRLCKNCKNPNAFHKPENCFVTNKKLRREWEEKTGKKFVPYQESNKDKSAGKKKNSKEDSDGGDESSDEDDDDRTFAKKSSSYTCVHLNRKNQSLIEQKRILFNIGAKTYITKLINNFNSRIYTPATLLLIITASREVKLLGFRR